MNDRYYDYDNPLGRGDGPDCGSCGGKGANLEPPLHPEIMGYGPDAPGMLIECAPCMGTGRQRPWPHRPHIATSTWGVPDAHGNADREQGAAMIYTKEQRDRLAAEAVGKTIKSLEWQPAEKGCSSYWVMTFTDDSETSFRFMAELVGEVGP